MKKTKIICTLGPSSDTEETISDLIDAGMNVARINFSHGTYEEQADKIEKVKRVRERKKVPIAIMLDTKGPEFRIGTFKNGKIFLKEGDKFTFTTEKIEGDQTKVSVSFSGICEQLVPGDRVLLNDGLMIFEVIEVKKPEVICKTIVGGELSNRKSMFFPDKELDMVYLSEQDKADIAFGVKLGIDYIACSFVSRAQDVIDIRNWLKECGSPEGEIEIIAKIESRAGVNNIDEILEASDGIMVARGDLGVEVPFEEVPSIQKTIIHKCRIQGKRSITATEMLESMIKNPRPTRAEISDVANAVYDGSSAIMLSGETAAGAHPVEAVKAMAKIAEQAEAYVSSAMAECDCCGGIIECTAEGLPAGLGEPVFDKLDALLAQAVMSVGAVKGVEIGDGFAAAVSSGSTNNDPFYMDGETVRKRTNHSGGTLGGMSDGSRLVLRAAVKPTPSIARPQSTVNESGEDAEITIHGRHDPVIVPRAVVVIESMAAITIADLLLQNMTSRIDKIKAFYTEKDDA